MSNSERTNSVQKTEKKVALITGANRGIGQQVAKELAGHGFIVLVGSRKLENSKKAVSEIGENAYPIAIDVTNKESILKAANQVNTEFGRLDVLVNNAGISHAGSSERSLEEILASGKASVADIDEMRAVWETNVFGLLAVTQAFLPLLHQAPSARIVNLSSGMASLNLNADPEYPYRGGFNVIYGAGKTAVNAITLALSIELESSNIRVEAASPGFAATAMNNFEGTETVEEASRNIVRAALGENDPSVLFSAPEGSFPW